MAKRDFLIANQARAQKERVAEEAIRAMVLKFNKSGIALAEQLKIPANPTPFVVHFSHDAGQLYIGRCCATAGEKIVIELFYECVSAEIIAHELAHAIDFYIRGKDADHDNYWQWIYHILGGKENYLQEMENITRRFGVGCF